MRPRSRGVTPVISVILLVAIVAILVAASSSPLLGLADNLEPPGPTVSDTTGEFEPGGNKQVVRITHVAGDSVDVENLEIVVRASGPDVDTEARLVDLPTDDFFSTAIGESNLQGNKALISESNGASNQVIVPADSNTWSAGRTIQFEINSAGTGADFRESPSGPDADRLEVVIVHSESNSVLSRHTFTP